SRQKYAEKSRLLLNRNLSVARRSKQITEKPRYYHTKERSTSSNGSHDRRQQTDLSGFLQTKGY
ncbi:MAG: hypothetical protein ACKO96_14130, partial [Flammeovirgaceae bacterium]